MWLVGIAWAYVVVMMTVAEATSDRGTLLGALFTLLLYGVLPLSIALYLLGTPLRRRRRDAEMAAASAASEAPALDAGAGPSPVVAALDPDRAGHPAGDAIAPERKEP